MSRLSRFTTMLGLMFATSGMSAFGLYFGLRAFLGHSPLEVVVPFAHIAPYLNRYPIPYLLSIAFIFALVSALWYAVITDTFPRFRWFQIAMIPFLVVLLTGPVWGMLWVYHDMEAGFFPDFPGMMGYLLFRAQQGVACG